MDHLPYERDFQREVLKRLRTIPLSWWAKLNDKTTVGLPDIVGCIGGVFIAIELKTKTKVTAIQAYTLRKIDDAKGQAFVCTPHNFDETFKFLNRLTPLAMPEDV